MILVIDIIASSIGVLVVNIAMEDVLGRVSATMRFWASGAARGVEYCNMGGNRILDVEDPHGVASGDIGGVFGFRKQQRAKWYQTEAPMGKDGMKFESDVHFCHGRSHVMLGWRWSGPFVQ